MPGASGVRAVNYLYNIAPRDGATVGIGQRATLVEPVFGSDQVKIDPRKLSWLGGLNTEWSVGIANPASGLTSIAAARQRDFPVSSSGAASDGSIYAAILNNVLGTRFKIITGYPGTAEEQLAMERGEVAGRVGWAWGSIQSTARDKLESGALKPFVLLSPTPLPGIDAPLARDFATSDEDRAVLDFAFAPQLFGRPFFGPPGVPADRLATLQKAFADTAADPAFLEEAERLRLDISYVPPQDLQALAERLYATPPHIVDRARRARQGHGY
jgi:tripartite-type tricarboxylate transporter receptor subunit TctC